MVKINIFYYSRIKNIYIAFVVCNIMAYIVKQKVYGKDYYYLRKSVREGDKVRSKFIAYLGKNKTEANKKAKEVIKKMEKGELVEDKKEKNVEEKNKKEYVKYDYNRIIELASRRSFFYPSAEIYPNSPKGFWDFGPIGQSIRRKIIDFWRHEFVQMEAEVFFNPNKINEIENFNEIRDYSIRVLLLGKENIEDISAEDLVNKKIVPGKLIAYFLARTQQVWNKLGIPLEKMRFREVDKDERAFYSLSTFDFEVETSLGWLELIANNYRTDYDLKGHMEHSKSNLKYTKDDGTRIIPHIWEISAGVDRILFAVLENSLIEGKEGFYLSLNPLIAPYDCAVFPLVKKKEIYDLSKQIEDILKNSWFDVYFDESGSIGRRYARNDEVGIPFCITIDGDSIKNKDVTIRYRDTTRQIRIKISEL